MCSFLSVSPSLEARAGIGFREAHEAAMFTARPAVGFLEVHAENYMGGGPAAALLRRLRAEWPISVHGVGLSLGSPAGVCEHHLQKLVRLVERIEPKLVSEHLSWSVLDGTYLNDLLPLPYTEESLAVVAANVLRVQDRLRRRILIENPSVYLRFRHSTMSEATFLAELVRRTGCGLLCDVNNLFVSAGNVGGDPYRAIAELPAAAVGEIHLAGHCVDQIDGQTLLIDDHGSRVAAAVWALFDQAVRRFPHAPPLIEWDRDLPELPVLLEEAAIADRRRSALLTEDDPAGKGRDAHVAAA